jgi:prepilin-type N-terminal cleavage/methylation domain-containing protein
MPKTPEVVIVMLLLCGILRTGGGNKLRRPELIDGFTLIEMVIVLGIISVLASILVPTLTKYVIDTRLRRAQNDVELISAAVGQFHYDTALMPVSSDYSGGTRNDVETLRGPGNDPVEPEASKQWLTGKKLDDLKDQIMNNAANYPTSGPNRWRGPYLSELREDPWGNSYLVNVRWVQPDNMTGANEIKSCFVLSAGPNGQIDTVFEGNAATPGDDDIVCRIK